MIAIGRRPEPLEVIQRETKGKPKATIVVLHGWGSSAREMVGAVSPYIPEEFRLVAIQAPMKAPGGGWMWYTLTAEGPIGGTLVTSLSRLEATLDPEAATVPRDAPMFLVGFSQGGTISLSFATLRFGWVNGVASLSGILFDDRTLPGPLGVLKSKPVLIVHGKTDIVRPPGMGRDAVRRLKSAGAIVDFMEHDLGHTAPPEAWARVVAWVRACMIGTQ